ncbi:MAG: hypothetical protein OXL96_18390 [Candidatus Poribacteria bacterium]|nr:hypothetical protein [Candidatus Poribacteria bacterium]
MNKHHGSKFDTYLKEKGTFEEVRRLTQKRWEELQTEKQENVSEVTENSPGHLARFFQWLRHAFSYLFL